MTLDKFAYAALAHKMQATNNRGASDKYIKGALDKFADTQAAGFSDIAKGFMEGAYSDGRSLQKATDVYQESHMAEMQGVTGDDLKNWYTGDVFNGLSAADKATFEGKLTEHGAETFGDISRAYRVAATKVEAPEGDYTEAEVAAARLVVDKYQTFMITNQELQDFKLEGLRGDTLEFSRKRHLKDLASKLIV